MMDLVTEDELQLLLCEGPVRQNRYPGSFCCAHGEGSRHCSADDKINRIVIFQSVQFLLKKIGDFRIANGIGCRQHLVTENKVGNVVSKKHDKEAGDPDQE